MSKNGEKRKAVAKCPKCEEIYPVHIWPDGTIHPLGSAEICTCDGSDLRILDGEDPVDELDG